MRPTVEHRASRDDVVPSSHFLEVGDLRLHYLDWGGKARHPVAFLHGGSLSARTYDNVCRSLRERYRCFALDLRGHGESDWSADLRYRVEDFAGDVSAGVDALGLRHVALVGHSLGGLTALAYAGEHPDRVTALALLDVGPSVQDAGSQRLLDFARATVEFESLDELVEHARAVAPGVSRDELRRKLSRRVRRLSDGSWSWIHDPRRLLPGVGDTPETFGRLWGHVRSLDCPTLVLRGERSDVFGAADAEALVSELRDATLAVIPEAGHIVQRDNPEAVAAELRRFLDTTTRTRTPR